MFLLVKENRQLLAVMIDRCIKIRGKWTGGGE